MLLFPSHHPPPLSLHPPILKLNNHHSTASSSSSFSSFSLSNNRFLGSAAAVKLSRYSQFPCIVNTKSPHRRRRPSAFFSTAATSIDVTVQTQAENADEDQVEESNGSSSSNNNNNKEEEEEEGENFIEVGYISKVHGLKGELRIRPTTDFPHLRFSKPGKRWLRSRVSGKQVISEVELIAGRDHPAQKSWIISLQGIDDADKAKQIVGSTLLVNEGDRPELEEGEFYTPDLVGMKVVLKDSDEDVGVVANVFNHGANDLLQVMLNSTTEKIGRSNSPKQSSPGQVAWVPFVEAIVPVVDMDKRQMFITPPRGLLELNLRNDMRSKKERRQTEWKERKKLQHRLAAAKRVLSEMQQNHILEHLKVGSKAEKRLLIDQIVNINFKLFQHAVKSIAMPSDRFNLSKFICANSVMLQKNALKTSSELLDNCSIKEKGLNYELLEEGSQLIVKSKAAIVVILKGEANMGNDLELDAKSFDLQEIILDRIGSLKVEGQAISIPLILVCPNHAIQAYKELFSDSNYFGLDSQKVWFVEEEKLPIVSLSSDNPKILTKSSYEIVQAPIGSGGVFSLLSSHGILDKLIEMGVEYVQICCSNGKARPATSGSLVLFGLVKSRGADMGLSVLMEEEMVVEDEDELSMVFSTRHLSKMCKQIDKLKFMAEENAHVEVEEEGRVVLLCSSIYSALATCPVDSISVMYIASD